MTCRRLRFRASGDGHDRANRIRRTARFEALLRKRVSDMVDVAVVVVVVAAAAAVVVVEVAVVVVVVVVISASL